MKYPLLRCLLILLLQGCYFGDNPSVYHKELPGGLRLNAMFRMEEMALFKKSSSGAVLNNTITKIGWTDNFVIAQSHPYPHGIPTDTIGSRILFREIKDSADIAYFLFHYRQDVVNMYGKWHLRYPYVEIKSDSTTDYKVLPRWSIVDVDNDCKTFNTYSYNEFREKRNAMGVPDTLSFFLSFHFEEYK
ncbi:MAG: hypothetical protein IPI91_20415 [Flavobacteriales bacterium]|nr:hypothetical protein [Flavobacteriales bacterium]